MKHINKIVLGIAACALVVPVVNSCSNDFLKEELTTQRNTDYFKTDEGIESLVTGPYQYLRFYICSETGYSYMNYGTDEYTEGSDNSNGMWNSYGAGLAPSVATVNSNTVNAYSLWDYMYTGINIANTLIDRVETGVYTGSNSGVVAGTGYFMRGLHYYNLVTQYGGVPLKLEPSTSVTFEFERASVSEVFNQIEQDLLAAYENLPEKASKTGEITKSAAAHFLAKAYLWRASELNDSWNSSTKTSDLQNVIKYADYVIERHPLATNFKDLWDYKEPDGANETLDEIVLASQFTSASSSWNVGGCMFFYTTSNYRDLTGMARDIPGGREYNRLRTTYYSLYVYDHLNDSRLWKTFRTKMNMCSNSATAKGYTPGEDRGLMYVLNMPGDERFDGHTIDANGKVQNLYRYDDATEEAGTGERLRDAETDRYVGTSFVFFHKGDDRWDIPMELNANNDTKKRYAMNTKYVDGSRESISDSHCFRDGIIARSAEDYFMKAEAYIRQGDYKSATDVLNIIRARAQWKAGEDRGEHVDGGQAWTGNVTASLPGISTYCDRSSYYESNNLPAGSMDAEASDLQVSDISSIASLPEEDKEIVNKLGLTSAYDVALCFLLNEKSREMSLELVRWVDLARTKTLISRCKAFNKEAAENIDEHHYLRPIPQSYLDVIKRDGHALTAAEKEEIQNPGY